jgi:hypothetical protein
LPSLGVRRPLSVNFSHFNLFPETSQLNELKHGRKHLWAVLISSRSINKHGHHRQFLFVIGRFLKLFSYETAWPNDQKLARKRPIRNKNCLWQPYLLMDQDEMSNLYRGPPIDASYQVSVHLQSGFRGEDFLEINQ